MPDLQELPQEPNQWRANTEYFFAEFQDGTFNFEIVCRPKSAYLEIRSWVDVAQEVTLFHQLGVNLTNLTYSIERKVNGLSDPLINTVKLAVPEVFTSDGHLVDYTGDPYPLTLEWAQAALSFVENFLQTQLPERFENQKVDTILHVHQDTAVSPRWFTEMLKTQGYTHNSIPLRGGQFSQIYTKQI